jgi:hypothetical protein
MIWLMVSKSSTRARVEFGEPGGTGRRPAPAAAADGAEPTLEGAFSADGVDLTAIRWMLERTPEERLQAAQQLVDAAWALRGDEA